MDHLFRVIVIIIMAIILTFLLATLVRPTDAAGTVSDIAATNEQPEDTELVCLALVGGIAILASGVLMGMMRRMMS